MRIIKKYVSVLVLPPFFPPGGENPSLFPPSSGGEVTAGFTPAKPLRKGDDGG